MFEAPRHVLFFILDSLLLESITDIRPSTLSLSYDIIRYQILVVINTVLVELLRSESVSIFYC